MEDQTTHDDKIDRYNIDIRPSQMNFQTYNSVPFFQFYATQNIVNKMT